MTFADYVQGWMTAPWWLKASSVAVPAIGVPALGAYSIGFADSVSVMEEQSPIEAGVKSGVSNFTTIALIAGAAYVGYRFLK